AAFVHGRGRIVPEYDRVASALVQQGWREQDPIFLFGPLFAYLHPLDWYLPGAQRLEVAGPAGPACDRVYVVAVGGRARALTAPLGDRVRRIGRTVVARLPNRPGVWSEVSRAQGHVLATRLSRCAR